MLIKGNIPKTEPTVSIGLVMPVDKQSSVEIENSADGKVYHIESNNEQIIMDDKSLPSIELKNKSNDSHFIIFPITAGRGFHWEKEISVKVLGNLKISNKDGFIPRLIFHSTDPTENITSTKQSFSFILLTN